MPRSVSAAVVAVIALFAFACESGTEVTTAGSATAVRGADGKVTVTARPACTLDEGQPRADNNCDSDGDEACFHADWVDHATPTNVLMRARVCKTIPHVLTNIGVSLTSPNVVPTDHPIDIVIYTDDQSHPNEDNSPTTIVIPSP